MHDITKLTIQLNNQLIRNPNSRLSMLFRKYRKNDKLCIYGDYPILSWIIVVAGESNIFYSRKEMSRAMCFSEELSYYEKNVKTVLLNNLSLLMSGGLK